MRYVTDRARTPLARGVLGSGKDGSSRDAAVRSGLCAPGDFPLPAACWVRGMIVRPGSAEWSAASSRR